MKKVLVLLVMLLSFNGFSQSINNYKYVVVPLKFDFISSDNQYRLATLSKFNLNKAGFDSYYSNQDIPAGLEQRCDLLSFDVIKEKSFLTTKLYVVFKDCYDKIVFQSEVGMSKQKDYQLAYTEALNRAFESVYAINYKYSGAAVAKAEVVAPKPAIVKAEAVVAQETTKVAEKIMPVANASVVDNSQFLYAQPVPNGFQLVDTTPKVVMKVFKTSSANCFIADKEGVNGVLIMKDGQWFFESYKNDQLVSEKIAVKF